MRIIITNSYEQMGLEAANIVAGQIYLKPDSVLGLATGSTPLSLYQRLIAVHETIGLDFSDIKTFNLDEYIGLAPDSPQSYHYFMHQHFFSHINIRPENIHLPSGIAQDMCFSAPTAERAAELAAAPPLRHRR